MSSTKVAVVGVGFHGRHHARLLAAHQGCRLIGVSDCNEKQCRSVAEEFSCAAVKNYRDLFDAVDAVIVATPTTSHFAVAADFLRRGIATLVEKPLAFSVEESAELVRLSRKHDALLQVGHIERFNPAFQRVFELCGNPQVVELQRYSRYPFRSLDVSVVFDVMIHDIDLAAALVDSEVQSVEATGACVVSPSFDRVDARLHFANGAVALLSADRTHFEPVRTLRAWSSEFRIDADLYRRTVSRTTAKRKAAESYAANLSPDERVQLWDELLPVERYVDDSGVESLRLEIEDFLRNVHFRSEPKVGGEAGLNAVAIATRIEAAAGRSANLGVRRAA